jgi:hypothetical protein
LQLEHNKWQVSIIKPELWAERVFELKSSKRTAGVDNVSVVMENGGLWFIICIAHVAVLATLLTYTNFSVKYFPPLEDDVSNANKEYLINPFHLCTCSRSC